MLRGSLPILVVVAVAALTLSGCLTYTCEGACSQYYGEDGCHKPSVDPTRSASWDPQEQCIRDCTDAMYSTIDSEGGSDDRNYRVLENQSDAMRFINDVAERDYSDAAFNSTCEDLEYSGWFKW